MWTETGPGPAARAGGRYRHDDAWSANRRRWHRRWTRACTAPAAWLNSWHPITSAATSVDRPVICLLLAGDSRWWRHGEHMTGCWPLGRWEQEQGAAGACGAPGRPAVQ